MTDSLKSATLWGGETRQIAVTTSTLLLRPNDLSSFLGGRGRAQASGGQAGRQADLPGLAGLERDEVIERLARSDFGNRLEADRLSFDLVFCRRFGADSRGDQIVWERHGQADIAGGRRAGIADLDLVGHLIT